MKKILLILLMFTVLLTTVSAQQEDFNAYGPVILKTSQCTSSQFPIEIRNSGSMESTYFIEVDGTAADWIKFSALSFKLAPGQSTIVTGFLDIPCEAYGDYTLDIYILTSYGLEKVIMQDITVEQSLNVDIKANVWSQKVSACQKAVYDLTVVNPSTFTDTYTLQVDQFKSVTEFSSNEFTLEANTSEDVIVEIQPKDCAVTGEYDVVFSATAKKTGTSAAIVLDLDIEDTGMAIIADGVDSIKSEVTEESAVELSVFNKHDSAKTYTLSLDGPSWVSKDTNSLSIGAEESETFILYIKPSQSVKPDDYKVTITATDSEGAEFSKDIVIKLRKSTIFSKLFGDYLIHTILGIILFVIMVGAIYFIVERFTNKDAQKAREKRKKERAKKKEELKKLKEKEKKLKEKEKLKKAKLLEKEKQKAVKKYEQKLKAEYELISKADIAEGKRVHDRWLFNLILFFVVLVLLYVAVKFRVVFWNNINYVLLGVAILVVLFILQRISRLRKTVARWRGLILTNEPLLMNVGWRKGLHQLSFKLDSPAKNVKAVAKKGRTRHAKYTHPKDFVYQYYRVYSSVQDVDIKESKFRFRVSKQWLKKREIKADDVSLMVLKGDRYVKLKATREGNDKNYVYYRATTDCLGQFAIVGKTSAKERYKPYWIAVLVLVILAVLGVGIVSMITADPQIQVKGIPPQMWDQDLQHSLDLNKYFNDPDGDELNFTFNELENIDVWVKDGVVSFMPDYKWSGQRTIVFTATDGKGGKISSNPVRLVVKKTIFPKEYIGYLKYVLIGVIILILLLAILIFRKPVMNWLNEE